jgi:hypothetical protein
VEDEVLKALLPAKPKFSGSDSAWLNFKWKFLNYIIAVSPVFPGFGVVGEGGQGDSNVLE